ncbi:hypothetical protein ABH15_06185 [Methanoculleus taiwanensis]|uniref:Uncharacterized protein n=1 Tax=Methanoculleus taiwanensis TaxID=1550565 RepID=A0A498H122_9EURY|nr:hypothetical protein [Methanoculleus taiwanensis]RXE56522.1 hypothetical protein ABH15_06185 [Methanoculleus taiwanensis]
MSTIAMTGSNPPSGFRLYVLTAALITALLFTVQVAAAQGEPAIEWNKTYGVDLKNKFESVQQTADGGYIAVGGSIGSNVPDPEDLLLVRTDSSGNLLWNRTWEDLTGSSVIEAGDGGYAVAANAINVTPGQTTGVRGTAYLIRTDDTGNPVWNRTFEGVKASIVRQTTEGGFILVGWTWNPAGSEQDTNAIIIKTDRDGSQEWNRTFAGKAAYAGEQTSDGGYILGGTASPFTFDVGDAFLIRLEADGAERWSKNLDFPSIYALSESTDGGFIITGSFWYARVDAEGNVLWSTRLQGLSGWAALQAPDGGYLIGGQVNDDAVAIRTDRQGEVQWNQTFRRGAVYSADLTEDGGYILGGITFPETGRTDAWLVKLQDLRQPDQATPGFGLLAAAGALVILLFLRRR